MDSGRVSPTSYLWPFGVLTSQSATTKRCWSKICFTPFQTTSVWMFPTLRNTNKRCFFHCQTMGKTEKTGKAWEISWRIYFHWENGRIIQWKKSDEWGQRGAGIASAEAAWRFWLPKGLQSSRAFQEVPGKSSYSFSSKSKLKFWGNCDYLKNLTQCEVPVGEGWSQAVVFKCWSPQKWQFRRGNNKSAGRTHPVLPTSAWEWWCRLDSVILENFSNLLHSVVLMHFVS